MPTDAESSSPPLSPRGRVVDHSSEASNDGDETRSKSTPGTLPRRLNEILSPTRRNQREIWRCVLPLRSTALGEEEL